ncbi:MAG TPA: DUF177 domain-containing protein [Rhodopila sp.]|nr:DUF177 domain-containing protein [Rhodopila sp.]
MNPECSRPIVLDRIGPAGLDVTVEATPAECGALALRMDLPAVHAMSCTFHLEREGRDVVLASGHLRARVTQTCVVTLEDFEADVEEDFRVRFVPEGEESEDVDLDADDEIPFTGNQVDVGEAAAEQLGLALDPYPRMPGAELPEPEEAPEDHPFGALRRLN